MKSVLRRLLPFIVVLAAVFYGLPTISIVMGPDLGFLMVFALLIVFPLVSLFTCMVCGIRDGFDWILPLLCGILFVPGVFIFYNVSALIYPVAYIVLGYIGQAIGYVIWRNHGNKPSGTVWR